MAGGARRSHRQRAERGGEHVAARSGPDRGRARGARLVQGVDRLSGLVLRDPHERRVGRQHDGDRVRARAGRRRDVGRPRRLRARPDPCVGGSGGPDSRLSPASGARAADRRALSDPARRARRGDRSGPRGRPPSAARVRERRQHEHRLRRPATRARRPVSRSRCLAPCRRRVRRVRRSRRTRRAASRGSRACRLRHARPAQVAVPALRVRLPARPRGVRPVRSLRHLARLPEGHGLPRGQPLRLRPAAEPLVAGAEGVALGPFLRARRLPRGDRPRHRPRAARRAPHRVEPRLRASLARLAGRRLLPPALPGPVRRARAGRPERPAERGDQRVGHRLPHVDAPPGEVRAAALHSQPHHDAGRRRRRPRLPRAGGARAAS